MDLIYLDEILKIRKQEISEGKNLITRQPIYVVLDLLENACGGHEDYLGSTNHKGKEREQGYIDLVEDEREFYHSSIGLKEPQEITRFWIDRVVAIFLTSEAAHSYLDYQKHNLSEGYVYVYSTGYSNKQMDKLLDGE